MVAYVMGILSMIGYGRLCLGDIDLSFNELHYLGTVRNFQTRFIFTSAASDMQTTIRTSTQRPKSTKKATPPTNTEHATTLETYPDTKSTEPVVQSSARPTTGKPTTETLTKQTTEVNKR